MSKIKRVKFPAGTYYVGDPCYIFNKSWGKILNDNQYFESDVTIIDGVECFVAPTKYGDGSYQDNSNRKYFVDSGTIGVLPIEMIEIDNKISIDEIDEYMYVFTFDRDFYVYWDDGYFRIGDNIVIETDNLYEDDDEDDAGWHNYYDEDSEFYGYYDEDDNF